MRKMEFTDERGTIWSQVSKREARKAWETNEPFVICASNMQPFGEWKCGQLVEPLEIKDGNVADFEELVSAFKFYNCSSETGRYPVYYI
jgi:hypothetical protein